ncbi:MAG: hypothetical protein ABIO55_08745 [Ginsengibacter sp.]
MYFWNKFCGFVVIFFLSAFFCGAQSDKISSSKFVKKPLFTPEIIFLSSNENQNIVRAPSKNIITSNYYTQHLGFVCKKEIALEKITNIPLRIRLGSLQQCNYLEGKK